LIVLQSRKDVEGSLFVVKRFEILVFFNWVDGFYYDLSVLIGNLILICGFVFLISEILNQDFSLL